jgi:hypothetical protein
MLQTSRSRPRDKAKGFGDPTPSAKTQPLPRLKVAKIGIVSRDYRHEYENGFKDFSAIFPDVLTLLDRKGCDTVVFSLYSIIPRKSFRPLQSIRRLRNVKAVLLEEGGRGQKNRQCVVFCRRGNEWHRYVLPGGGFPSLKGLTDKKKREKVGKFVHCVIPDRTLGNCCAILCGEINGVPYHKDTGTVQDDFFLREALRREVTVVLNPGHDRMMRFEMPLKRAFLSKNGRWVISVWNKGKWDSSNRKRGTPSGLTGNGGPLASGWIPILLGHALQSAKASLRREKGFQTDPRIDLVFDACPLLPRVEKRRPRGARLRRSTKCA